MRRRSFTLIELLTTIAIMVILASLLLPALSRAKEKAREIGCNSNLKQIGTAYQMYGNDYNEYFAPWLNGTYTVSQYVGYYEYNNTMGDRAGWGGKIYPYLGGKGHWRTFICPSDPFKRNLTDYASNSGQGTGASYMANSGNSTGSGGIGFDYSLTPGAGTSLWYRYTNAAWPAGTCLVSEEPFKWSGYTLPGYYGLFYRPWGGKSYVPSHLSVNNVVFVDGHVKSVPITPYFNTAYPYPVASFGDIGQFYFLK